MRRAITIVELLVVIGIVAIIISIAIPAIQVARESARRTQCQNNLRQVLLATQSHHAAERVLPSFYNGSALQYPLSEWDLFHMHSWRVPLLPYLEQAALKKQLKWNALATAVENASVAQSVVPVFLCPSGEDPSNMWRGLKHGAVGILPTPNIPEKDLYYVVRSDYDAMAGIRVLPEPLPPNANEFSVDYIRWGIWGWAVFDSKETSHGARVLRYRQGRFSDVTDGLSNTIAIIERGGKPYDMLNGKRNVTDYNPEAKYPGQVGWSASNSFYWSINDSGVGVNESNSSGIYSVHPGGANVGIADGSVRFLSDSTDFKALVSLYGKADSGLPVRP